MIAGAVGAWLFDWGTTTTVLVGAGMFVLIMALNVLQAIGAARGRVRGGDL